MTQLIPDLLYVFRAPSPEWECLPLLREAALEAEPIQLSDQVGAFRLKSGDVLRLARVLPDGAHCLCRHSACAGLLVVDVRHLTDLPS